MPLKEKSSTIIFINCSSILIPKVNLLSVPIESMNLIIISEKKILSGPSDNNISGILPSFFIIFFIIFGLKNNDIKSLIINIIFFTVYLSKANIPDISKTFDVSQAVYSLSSSLILFLLIF